MTGDEHPREAEAIEYVLGTLPAVERAAFEADLARDPGLVALVRSWEGHLSPLSERVEEIAPPREVWVRLSGAIDRPRGADLFDLPALRRSRARWRAAAVVATGLAAALAVFVALPDRTPPKPSLVAVVNRAGDLPALIVRVDPATRIVTVRAVAAETPGDRSLELWSVAGGAPPRSLGVLPGGTQRLTFQSGASLADGVTLAVSVEPRGGSPTGAPTGPVVYSGKLIPDAP